MSEEQFTYLPAAEQKEVERLKNLWMNQVLDKIELAPGRRFVPCPQCLQHEVTATESRHYEPGMGDGLLTTYGPCTSKMAPTSTTYTPSDSEEKT